MRLFMAVVCGSVLVFSSLVLAQEEAKKADPLARLPSPDGAKVYFANIEDGAEVSGTFTVEFVIEGMDVAKAGDDVKNSGHHHILINATELPALNLPLPKSDTVRHFGGGETSVDLDLPAGEHTLQLVFADYRHIPHDPPVMSEAITVIVQE